MSVIFRFILFWGLFLGLSCYASDGVEERNQETRLSLTSRTESFQCEYNPEYVPAESSFSPDFDVRFVQSLFFRSRSPTLETVPLNESDSDSVPPFQNLPLLDIEPEGIPFPSPFRWYDYRKKEVCGEVLLGLSQAAYTPVFLQTLQSVLEIDYTHPWIGYGVPTVVGLLLSADSTVLNAGISLNRLKKEKGRYAWAGKAFLVSLSALPVFQLFHTENSHRLRDGMPGLYISLFAVGSLPLAINAYRQTREDVFDLSGQSRCLTQSQKVGAYGAVILGRVAQGMAWYAVMMNALTALYDDDTGYHKEIFSLVAGGVFANSMSAMAQLNGFRSLFEMSEEERHSSLWKKGMKVAGKGLLLGLGVLKSAPAAATLYTYFTNIPEGVRGVLSGSLMVLDGIRFRGAQNSAVKKISSGLKKHSLIRNSS